jgi:hypothetical protein
MPVFDLLLCQIRKMLSDFRIQVKVASFDKELGILEDSLLGCLWNERFESLEMLGDNCWEGFLLGIRVDVFSESKEDENELKMLVRDLREKGDPFAVDGH